MSTHIETLDNSLKYFAVEPALTREQQIDAARLRHQVYCEEFGYEPVMADGMEADNHDRHSLHCVVRHRGSGMAAGCVRLICASEDTTMAIEQHCLGSLNLEHLERLGNARDSTCEVSRLAVSPAFRGFRRRTSTGFLEVGDNQQFCNAERQCFPLVTLAVYLSAFATADLAGRPNLFGMMEASLPRLLRRAGIHVRRAGDFMDYHGRRAPHFITVEEAIAGMSPAVETLYSSIHSTLSKRLACQGTVAVA